MLTDKQFISNFSKTDWLYGVYNLYTDDHEYGDYYILPKDKESQLKELIDTLWDDYISYFEAFGNRFNVIVDLFCVGIISETKDKEKIQQQLGDFLKKTKYDNLYQFVKAVLEEKPHNMDSYIDFTYYCYTLEKYAPNKTVAKKWLKKAYMYDNKYLESKETTDIILGDIFRAATLYDISKVFRATSKI